jgi:hypothetical protein
MTAWPKRIEEFALRLEGLTNDVDRLSTEVSFTCYYSDALQHSNAMEITIVVRIY